jgi:hypothetical protein
MNSIDKRFRLYSHAVAGWIRPTLAFLGGSMLAVLPADPARATGVPQVDQQLVAVEQAGIAIDYSQSWGQTFTVGLAGSLTRIDLQLGRDASANQPLQFELRTTSGGLPNLTPQALLFSTSINPSAVPVLTTTTPYTLSVDLSSAPPEVTPGEQLAILLTSGTDYWYLWTTGYWPSDFYTAGSAVKRPYGAADWQLIDGWDSGFRTWVTVPEPVSLLPIGLLLLAFRHRDERV